MKREFITGLLPDISKETLDQIMAEHGKSVEAQKAQTTAAEANLATANQTIKDLQAAVQKFDGVDVANLNQQITDLQSKYAADTARMKLDAAVDLAIMQAKARNPKAVKGLLDPAKLKLKDDGTVEGLDLAALQKSDPYLFEIEGRKPEGAGFQDGKPDKDPPPQTLAGVVYDIVSERMK